MSLLVFPTFEKHLNYQAATTGEFIGEYYDELEQIAEDHGFTPLSYFDSINNNEAIKKAFENYDGETDPDEIIKSIPHQETWYPAKDGLVTINSYLKFFKENPDEIDDLVEGVLDELRDLKTILEIAQKEDTKFQLKNN